MRWGKKKKWENKRKAVRSVNNPGTREKEGRVAQWTSHGLEVKDQGALLHPLPTTV